MSDETRVAFAKFSTVMHAVDYHNELTARVDQLAAKARLNPEVTKELDHQSNRLQRLREKLAGMFPVDLPQLPEHGGE